MKVLSKNNLKSVQGGFFFCMMNDWSTGDCIWGYNSDVLLEVL